MASDGGTPPVGKHRTYEQRCSVERSPLLAINPKQILPIPLHTTQGDNHRYLRLAIEMGMVCRNASDGASAGRKAGANFSLELVRLLHKKGRVRPTPYHGGLSIGRDCCIIGKNCAIVCAALKGKVSQTHLAPQKLAWSLWNGVGKTLYWAAVAPTDEVARFRSDTAAMVISLISSFPSL